MQTCLLHFCASILSKAINNFVDLGEIFPGGFEIFENGFQHQDTCTSLSFESVKGTTVDVDVVVIVGDVLETKLGSFFSLAAIRFSK